jgi:hypothetical protein
VSSGGPADTIPARGLLEFIRQFVFDFLFSIKRTGSVTQAAELSIANPFELFNDANIPSIGVSRVQNRFH